MNIGWIEISLKKYGGVIYNQEAREALADDFNVELVVAEPRYFSKIRYLRIPESLFYLRRLSGQKDIWVRDFYSTLTMPLDKTSGKNIVVIHHDDFSGFPFLVRPIFKIAQKFFYRNLKKADGIITVSEYWRKYFVDKGYRNVYKIYNGFNVEDFIFSDQEILDFKSKYNLSDKPIVYLGNCQKAKGVAESYNALKDLDVYLVTSGRKKVNVKTINFDLSYRDYLRLLKASDVVITMSKFREGWCRTAHEAMLCEVPVIGSGRGGMQELLEGGKQIICPEFKNLSKEVEDLLGNERKRKVTGENGYAYAKDFTKDKFKEDWINLIKKIK